MKKVTISDVAKHAGVSKSTVSQYLNGRYDYMSEHTQKKIEATIKALNYHPNIVARSLTQKKTYTVGVIVANNLRIRYSSRSYDERYYEVVLWSN